jgi:archaemetzincin
MTVGILPIGDVDKSILVHIGEGLPRIFPDTKCQVVEERFPLGEDTFDKKRGQYRSNQILGAIQSYAVKKGFSRILGVLDVDVFVPELNFVFGEAAFPGKGALISLWRLKPEFYGESAKRNLLLERSLKEAVHEIGHTLGLRHCQRFSCVMHFSNSIFDTDRKQKLFCDECYLQASIAIDCLK